MALRMVDVIQVVAWVETLAVLFSTFSRTMIPLRVASLVASVAGALGGALGGGLAALAQHCVLLPIHAIRLREMTRLIASVKAASETDLNVEWLKPFMHERRCVAGETIFAKGETAQEAFMLVEGAIDLVELDVALAPGALFGEMALFTLEGRRTATARCATDCRILRISYSEFEQLYFQNPQFGLYLVRLIARRYDQNLEQARAAGARNLAETGVGC